jgi:hypothetical protein
LGTLEDRRSKIEDGGLATSDPRSSILDPQTIRGAQSHGLDAGPWCPYGLRGDYPPDQRAEDGKALCFTSAPLDTPLEILGVPEATLEVAVDQPCALLAVRLCDVAPDGASALVTRGLLNLTHRDGHERPEPLEPGRRYAVTVRLNAIAHVLPAGHRWRLAVAPTYWPHAWPSPAPVTLSVFAAGSRLDLPVRAPRAEDAELPAFGPPEGAAPLAREVLRAPDRQYSVRHDVVGATFELVDRSDAGWVRLPGGLEYDNVSTSTFTIAEGDPLSAHQRCDHAILLARGDWRTRVVTTSTLSADAESFHTTNTVEAYEGEAQVFARTWRCTIPRDLV